jgi:uncharacterized integral membrane protein
VDHLGLGLTIYMQIYDTVYSYGFANLELTKINFKPLDCLVIHATDKKPQIIGLLHVCFSRIRGLTAPRNKTTIQ